MNKKELFCSIFTVILCISFLMVPCYAEPITTLSVQGDNSQPLYVGKWINAGTVESIDTEKMLLVIRVLDNNYYVDNNNNGMLTLKVNDSTQIKIGNDNFVNFEDLKVNDNIGFTGYWNGNLLSADSIQLFQDPTNSRYFTNAYNNTNGNTDTVVTYSSSSTTTSTSTPGYSSQIITDAPTNIAYNTLTKGHTPSAALSNLEIAKVIIRTGGNSGAKINFRVRTFNGGSADISGENFTINLYIREKSSDQYELIKSWDEKNVKSQDILSRDYFITSPNPYVQMHNFQVKADLVDGAGNIFRTFEQDYAGSDIL